MKETNEFYIIEIGEPRKTETPKKEKKCVFTLARFTPSQEWEKNITKTTK